MGTATRCVQTTTQTISFSPFQTEARIFASFGVFFILTATIAGHHADSLAFHQDSTDRARQPFFPRIIHLLCRPWPSGDCSEALSLSCGLPPHSSDRAETSDLDQRQTTSRFSKKGTFMASTSYADCTPIAATVQRIEEKGHSSDSSGPESMAGYLDCQSCFDLCVIQQHLPASQALSSTWRRRLYTTSASAAPNVLWRLWGNLPGSRR